MTLGLRDGDPGVQGNPKVGLTQHVVLVVVIKITKYMY